MPPHFPYHLIFPMFVLFSAGLRLCGDEYANIKYRTQDIAQIQASFKSNLRQLEEKMEAMEKKLYQNIEFKPLPRRILYQPKDFNLRDLNRSKFPVSRSIYNRNSSAHPLSPSEPRFLSSLPKRELSNPFSVDSVISTGPNLNIQSVFSDSNRTQSFVPLSLNNKTVFIPEPSVPDSIRPISRKPSISLPQVDLTFQSQDELRPSKYSENEPSKPMVTPGGEISTETVFTERPLAKTPVQPELFLYTYPVQSLTINYGGDSQGLPNLGPISQTALEGEKGNLISLKPLLSGNRNSPVVEFTAQNFRELSQLILHYLKGKGLEGMVAMVDPKDIDPFTGKDLRVGGDHSLEFVVWVARVDDVRLDYSSKIKINRDLRKIERQISDQMNRINVLGQPLRTSFKQSLQRLNRHPSKSARLLLLPAARPGEVDAVVEVREQKNLAFSLGASNSGSPTTGEGLINGTLQAHELTRNDDPADFSWVISDSGERYGFSGGYLIPLIQPGVLDLALRTTYSEYDGTSFAVTAFEFEGSSWSADLALRGAPLSWEGKTHTFTYEFGLNFERARAFNSIFLEQAQVDFILPRFALSHKFESGVIRSLSSLLFRTNLSSIPVEQQELFGGLEVDDQVPSLLFSHASLLNLNELFGDGNPSFGPQDGRTLLFQLTAAGSLQSDRMLPSMQSILGGASGVRGYPEACVAGDRAFWLSLEYRWKFFSSGAYSLTLSPFLDYGQTYLHNELPHEAENTLASWGIGLGINLPGGGQARLDFAKPLQEVVNGSGDIREGTTSDDYRVHASTQWEF